MLLLFFDTGLLLGWPSFDTSPERSPIKQAIINSAVFLAPHGSFRLLLLLGHATVDHWQVLLWLLLPKFDLVEILILPLAQDVHLDLEVYLNFVDKAIDACSSRSVI